MTPRRWRFSDASTTQVPQLACKQSKQRTPIYALRGIPGQSVEFIERAGEIAREIGTSRKTYGQLKFTPLAVPGRHRVEAIVEQYGMSRTIAPIKQYTVTR